LVFIRFNPDEYITKDAKVTSCWSLNGQGICIVKNTKQKEWTERLEALKNQIEYWLENKTEKTVEIIQLFYDCD
jgi:Holliday junction resolvasome RuvABC endonuclease subunit